MSTQKLGPVGKEERTRYRARLLSDAEAGRPTPTTAFAVCDLVGVDPATLRAARDREDQLAAQAFTVALDTLFALGDQGERLTTNLIFDALGRYWSFNYQAAMAKGAMSSYDMTDQRLKDTARELTVAGVNVEAIWRLLIARPESTKLPQLYDLVRWPGRGHAHGRRVELRDGALLDDVRYTILRDAQYERPVKHRLVRAEDKTPKLPQRQDVCEERPYNIVNLDQYSRYILGILEDGGVRFYVEQFREDYETFADYLKIHPRNATTAQRLRRDQLAGLVNGLRHVYEQTGGIVAERDGEAALRFGGREKDGYVTIRSRFFRAINRRFHAADFWPEHVDGDWRERWFGLDPITPRWPADELTEDDHFVNRETSSAYVERDVSASQTQMLAAFLGNDDLAKQAGSRNPKFKAYLAQQLWSLHERHGVLAKGYDGPSDPRLVEFIGEIWMRRNYGGKFGQTVLDLANDRETYGRGWSPGYIARGVIRRATQYFQMFLSALPAWSSEVTMYLNACRFIGLRAAASGGVVFRDPLDGAEVRWNPIRRAAKKIAVFDKMHVEAYLSGVRRKIGATKRPMFQPQPWQVDRRELSQKVAPFLVHTLDAYFNALVVERLHDAGAKNLIAIHDAWFVPSIVRRFDMDDVIQLGREALADAIEGAGRDWLRDHNTPDAWVLPGPPSPEYVRYLREFRPPGIGIGMVYEWLIAQLTGTPYEAFAKRVYDRWRQRLAEGRYPKLTAV